MLPLKLVFSFYVIVVVLLALDCSLFAGAQLVDPSAAPSSEPCHDELITIKDCFAGELKATPSKCVDCVKTFWQNDASLCTDIDDETCAGLLQCSPQDCASCGSAIHQYIQCLSGCAFECPTTAPSPSAPTVLAPTTSHCPDERDAFNQCVESPSGSVSECEACVVSFWPPSSSSSQLGATTTTSSAAADPGFYPPSECAVIESDTCRGLTNCNDLCGKCESEFVTYFECETSCTLDNTDCAAIPAGGPSAPAPSKPSTSGGGSGGTNTERTPTAAPTLDNPCPDEYQTFNDCVGSGSDCEDCVIAYWDPNVTSCASIDDETCTGLSKCSSCTNCEASFVTYLVCLTKDACTWDCPTFVASDGGDPVTPTPTPILANPTPSSGGTATTTPDDEQCTEPLGTLEDCLATKVTGAQRDECHSCASAAYDAGRDATSPRGTAPCSELQDDVCAALNGECATLCGDCSDVYRAYLDCRATKEVSGCSIADCSSSSSGTVAAPLEQGSTSSAKALAGSTRSTRMVAVLAATLWAGHQLVV